MSGCPLVEKLTLARRAGNIEDYVDTVDFDSD